MSSKDWSDTVFLQLGSMARDMNMKVRVEAFEALGRIGMISEVLLQTLSKKSSKITKEVKHLYRCSAEVLEKHLSSIAAAFVHGLEDEFYEVRSTACQSLQTFSVLSADFAKEALELLMNLLDDYSVVVRSEVVKTMHHMALHDCMVLHEANVRMFLSSVVDDSIFIRSGARKILKLMKLPNFNTFKACLRGLQKNLELYPKEEADIFSLLFKIGRAHENFVLCIIRDGFPEIKSFFDGNLDLDSTRVASLLVLAISAPSAVQKLGSSISPRIFSYALSFLGRFSYALRDIMSQDTLLSYISRCTGSTTVPPTEFSLKKVDSSIPLVDFANSTGGQMESHQEECPSVAYNEVAKSLNAILTKIKDLWPLVKLVRTSEVIGALRVCKGELATFVTEPLGCAGSVAFVLQYVKVVKLLVKVWEHMLKNLACSVGRLDLILRKLSKTLKEIHCRFLGLNGEDELHILELILVTLIMRVSIIENCLNSTTLKVVRATISHVNCLCKEGSMKPSGFVVELENSVDRLGTSADGDFCSLGPFKKILDCFSLRLFVLHENLKHVKAEMELPGYDPVNPRLFVHGLPVGIPLQITLCNFLYGARLWLRMSVNQGLAQFVFLDSDQCEDCDGVKKLTFIAPFYRTPKAVSFKVGVTIGMECGFEEVDLVEGFGGPKHPLVHLCKEKEVFLSVV